MAARTFRRGTRRKTEWGGFGDQAGGAALPDVIAIAAGAGNRQILSKDIVTAGLAAVAAQEYTITRMIGHLTVALNVTTAVATATIAVACGIAREDAITAGVASLPAPEDDPDFEWLFYSSIFLKNPNDTSQTGPASTRIISFDVRGQRIVRAGNIPFWIASCVTSNCQAAATGCYLVKLP